jgi:hypothetical protein
MVMVSARLTRRWRLSYRHDLTTDLLGAEAPLEPTADAPAVKFTEEQARQWLAAHGTQSVRLLAKLWGWHPSKVQRLLNHAAQTGEGAGADASARTMVARNQRMAGGQMMDAVVEYRNDQPDEQENDRLDHLFCELRCAKTCVSCACSR